MRLGMLVLAVLLSSPGGGELVVDGEGCVDVRSGDPEAVEAVMTTLDRWARAIESGDLPALGDLVTEDAEFWTHGQPALRGRPSLEAAWAPIMDRYTMEQRFHCDELIISDGLAVMRGTEENRLTPRDGGDEVVQRQRALSILLRGEDGVWRFARGMTNAPGSE